VRLGGIVAVALAMLAGTTSPGHANEPTPRVDVRADTIAFYPSGRQALLSAHGHAVVRVAARTIEADAVRYDISAGVLTASGNVHVSGRGDTLAAAVYRLELASDRAYLIRPDPLPATLELQGDETATAREAAAPPGTFDLVDLDEQRPYVRSRHAVVVPAAGVRLTPAQFPTGAGIAPSLPTYLYTLVSDPNIAQSAGPGASFDQPYNLFGSANSLTAAHLRYDSPGGFTGSLDTRFVDGARAYAVTSLVPLRDRRADVVAFAQLRPGLQHTFLGSHGFGPYAFTSLDYRLQATGPSAIVSFSAGEFNTSNRVELALSTIAHDVGHYFSYQLRAAYGRDHELYGYPFANAYRTTLGGYIAPPGIALAGTILSARYDYRATAYDYARRSTSAAVTLTGARRFPHGIGLFARVVFDQANERYRDAAVAARALALPDRSRPYFAPDGTLFSGYFAYAGLRTDRTYELATTFAGRASEDRVAVTLTHTRDFPQSFGYGRPPFVASVAVTRRLTRTIRIDLGRAYAFGWNGRYLSPRYTFAISP